MASGMDQSYFRLEKLPVRFIPLKEGLKHGLLNVVKEMRCNDGEVIPEGAFFVKMNGMQWSSFDDQEHVNGSLRARGLFNFEWKATRFEFIKQEHEEYARLLEGKRGGKKKASMRVKDGEDESAMNVERRDVVVSVHESSSLLQLNVDRQREKDRLRAMSSSLREYDLARRRVESMSELEHDAQNKRKRIESMSESERERERERKRIANMSESDIDNERKRKRIESMSESERDRERERKRIANMSESGIDNQRKCRRIECMSESERERERERHRIERLTPVQIQRKQLRNRMEEMTVDANEAHRLRNRIEGMTDNEIENRRTRQSVENLTPERIEYLRKKKNIEYQRDKMKRNLEIRRKAALTERTKLVLKRAEKMQFQSLNLTWDFTCEHCGCLYLNSMGPSKRTLCCDSGKLILDPTMKKYAFEPMDLDMYELLKNNFEHLQTSSLYYNSILALGATAVDTRNDPVDSQKWLHIHGAHGVKVHGRTTHFLPSANSSKTTSGIEFFTFHKVDVPSLEHVPEAVRQQVKDELLLAFSNRLKADNKWVRDCVNVGEYLKEHNQLENEDEVLCREVSQSTSVFDVGCITSDYQTGNRVVLYLPKGDDTWTINNALSENMEPLCYPLLFLKGEPGWGFKKDRKKINFHSYMCGKIFQPEKLSNGEYLMYPNINGELMKLNRLSLMPRLGQTYIVDMMSRYIDFNLNFVSNNQSMFRGNKPTVVTDTLNDTTNTNNVHSSTHTTINDEHANVNTTYVPLNNIIEPITNTSRTSNTTYSVHPASVLNYNNLANDFDNVDMSGIESNEGPTENEKVFLSDSFHGGQRHLSKLALQGLQIVNELGGPTMFITLTANPNWPELLERLAQYQNAFTRAEIINMIFNEKKEILLHNLKAGKYTKGGVPVYILHVVEWQERGLPHIHIVLRLSNHPEPNCEIDFIDEFICAERTRVHDDDDEETKRYKYYVDSYMIHKCYSVSKGGCLDANGICKRGYNQLEKKETIIDDRGFPQYRRRLNTDYDEYPNEKRKDLSVVPHNKDLLLDWNGHANVEFCGSAYTLCYLYKYLYKGPKAKTVELSNRFRKENGQPLHNEIDIYIRGRYLCANEAIWRLMKHDSYPSPSPPVITVKVTLPSELELTVNDGNTSHMELYLRRPLEYEDYTFSEFWSKYMYDKKLSKFAEKNNKYFETDFTNRKNYYVYERSDVSDRTLVRIGTVSYTCGEKFYLRLLMMYRIIPCAKFDDSYTIDISLLYNNIRTVDDICYNTFQEAAVAAGIVENIEVMVEIFETYQTTSPLNKRLLFANLTVNGYPTKFIFDLDEWILLMTDDMKQNYRYSTNIDLLRELLLEHLQKILQTEYNKELCEFGLPTPKNVTTELNEMLIQYKAPVQQQILDELNARFPLTEEQQEIFDTITKCIDEMIEAHNTNLNIDGMIFMLTGRAGCGKTVLAQKLAAYTRSVSGVAVGCAATALAATIYDDNWLTAHSLFAYPVDNERDEDNYNEDGTKKMLKCRINEPRFKHRKELLRAASLILWDEAAANTRSMLNSVYTELNELKNTVMVLIGGFEQILPIIERGAPKQRILSECICRWSHWQYVKVFVLHKSLRLIDDCENEEERMKRNDYEKYLDALSAGKEIPPNTNYFAETVMLTDEEKIEQQTHVTAHDIMNDTMYYKLTNMNIVIEKEDITMNPPSDTEQYIFNPEIQSVLTFLYGKNYELFNDPLSLNCYICAAINDRVKAWNKIVQKLNPNKAVIFKSSNWLADVDDIYGYLKTMFNIDKINDEMDDSDVPDHTLKLKLNDICLLTTNWSKRCGLTKNTKVKITYLEQYDKHKIGIKPVNKMDGEVYYITKVNLPFTFHHGCSYRIIRNQFPLRLAYCLTYNRAQGQTADKVTLDVVHPPFSHGQFYVASTRTRYYNNTMIYGHERQLKNDGKIIVPNITHKEVLIHENEP